MASGFRPTGGGGGGGGVLAGDVSGPLLANVINPGVVTGGAGGKIADNTVTASNEASDAVPFNNELTNPGFNFAQLQDPTVATLIADNQVGPDAWKCTRETADMTYQRVSNALLAGYNSRFSGRFTKTVAAGKMMVYQPLESLITHNYSNNVGVFTVHLNLSVARRMRMGFIVFNGGSLNPVVPAPVAAWNGAGVTPTLNAGFFYLANFQLNGGAPIAAGLSAWDVVTGVLPSFNVNDVLCVFVCTDEAFAAGDFFDLFETSLDQANSGRFTWKALDVADDIGRVQRFIEKSYNLDTIPGTVTVVGRLFETLGAGTAVSATSVATQRKVRTPLVADITLYNDSTGASGSWVDQASAANIAVLPNSPGEKGFGVTGPNGLSGDTASGHYLVNTSM